MQKRLGVGGTGHLYAKKATNKQISSKTGNHFKAFFFFFILDLKQVEIGTEDTCRKEAVAPTPVSGCPLVKSASATGPAASLPKQLPYFFGFPFKPQLLNP